MISLGRLSFRERDTKAKLVDIELFMTKDPCGQEKSICGAKNACQRACKITRIVPALVFVPRSCGLEHVNTSSAKSDISCLELAGTDPGANNADHAKLSQIPRMQGNS